MKKILFLLVIMLAFASCDNGSSNYDFTQLDTYFTGVTTNGETFTILASHTTIIYTQASPSESFTFILTNTGDEYKANATMGSTADRYTETMWDSLIIKTDVNKVGYDIRKAVVETDNTNGQYTFTIIGEYESPIEDLTTNTTSIEVVFEGNSGEKSYELTEKFIAAIKNYF